MTPAGDNVGGTMLRSYVVRVDHGFAPNPYGGYLTLTCCKPRIRKRAEIGSWVLGTHRTEVNSLAVCFLGQVSDAMDFDTYARDPRFEAKDPSPQGEGDRVYIRNSSGHLVQRRNRRHGPDLFAHDASVDRMLVMERFWYFGSLIRELPATLASQVTKSGQGHKNVSDPAIIEQLVMWASQFPNGLLGSPLDADSNPCRKTPQRRRRC